MSGAKTIQSKNKPVETIESHSSFLKAKHDIIYHFQNYVLDIYGRDAWECLIEDGQFNTLFYETVYKYGIAVFQELVNISAKKLDISIQDILKSFGRYYQTNK